MSDQLRALIDESDLTGLQLTVLAVCFFLNMLDGMDVLAISFAAPAIAEEWAITPQSLGAGISIGWTFAIYAVPMILAALFVTRIRLPGSA